jgi:hypothetical protein
MDEQTQLYNDLERMFATPGWEHLHKGFLEEQQALPLMAFLNADTSEELERYRIRYELLTQLIELPDQISAERRAYEEAEDENV